MNLAPFLYYLKERESIRLKREAGAPWPWTGDPILQKYKFTNVKREHDRTTRTFVNFYREHYRKKDILRNDMLLYNCGVARYFGTVEFQREVGWLPVHDGKRLVATARRMLKEGRQVFTGAYMITNAGRLGPKEKVVAAFLRNLWGRAEVILDLMYKERSWRAAYEELRTLPGFGATGFMAKEVLQDFMLVSDISVNDAETWTPMGPGARRGMNRLHGRPIKFRQHEQEFIREVLELYAQIHPWWTDTFPQSGELTAHDVQFCLCELDKYLRVANNEGKPRSLYRPSHEWQKVAI